MPFVSRKEGDRLRAEGKQVWSLPSAPPDGLTHYASTKRHFMCHPVSMELQKGSADWARVTCVECLRMGKRTERLDKQGNLKPVVKNMAHARNQDSE